MMEEYPKLRPIEASLIELEEGQRICLMDPSGMASGQIVLTRPAFFIVSQLDGEHSLLDIQANFMKQFGTVLFSHDLQSLITQLDEAHLLDSPAFAHHRHGLVEAYREAPARPSRYASGPLGDPGVIRDQIQTALNAGNPAEGAQRLSGLIVPHLDFERGAPCYGAGYTTLRERNGPGRFVILGANHFGASDSFVATIKPFQTPLGLAATDTEFLDALDRATDVDLYEHEIDHRTEHSVELQVLMLQGLYASDDISIVPLLCPDGCSDGRDRAELDGFAEALVSAIAANSNETCVIAGADLSHVGPRFGDSTALTGSFLEQIEREDRELLAFVERGDPEGFLSTLQDNGNPRRVCSSAPIYVLMKVLGNQPRTLLRYEQSINQENGIGVTSATVIFERV